MSDRRDGRHDGLHDDRRDGTPDAPHDGSGTHDDGHDADGHPGRRPRGEFSEGGDPVCWLDRVCEECGAMREDTASAVCARCGTPFPSPGADPGADAAAPGPDGGRPRGE